MNTLPPPEPPAPNRSRKWAWLAAGGVALTAAIAIGAATEDEAPVDDAAPVETIVETTEAPAPTTSEDTRVTAPQVTEAPTTTQAPPPPPPPPPPVPVRENFYADNWRDFGLYTIADYCYTDCVPDVEFSAYEPFYENAQTFNGQLFYEEQLIYLDGLADFEIDGICDGFFFMIEDPDAMVSMMIENGIATLDAQAGYTLATLEVCDS